MNKMNIKLCRPFFATTLSLFLIFAVSCGDTAQHNEESGISYDNEFDKSLNVAGGEDEGRAQQKEVVDVQRKIIKEGSIRFQTKDASTTKSHIETQVKLFNGYISKDNIYDYSDRTTYELTVRIPAANFDKLLESIASDIGKLDHKNIDVKDVTEEFIDVKARLNTKKQLEERYTQLLAKASTVSDILNIEREITTLRSEIESIEGRLKYLSDRVQYSTLSMEFYEQQGVDFGFGGKFADALGRGWDFMLIFLIGITHLWPFAALTVVLIYVIKRYLRYRKRKKTENS